MVGLSSSDAAGRWSSRQATAERNTGGSDADDDAVRKAFRPSLQHERWMWPLDPSSPGALFARKLARRPIDDARSLTAIFRSVASSAARSPGRAARFSSSSPGAAPVGTAER